MVSARAAHLKNVFRFIFCFLSIALSLACKGSDYDNSRSLVYSGFNGNAVAINFKVLQYKSTMLSLQPKNFQLTTVKNGKRQDFERWRIPD
jgi:hypothetical protein